MHTCERGVLYICVCGQARPWGGQKSFLFSGTPANADADVGYLPCTMYHVPSPASGIGKARGLEARGALSEVGETTERTNMWEIFRVWRSSACRYTCRTPTCIRMRMGGREQGCVCATLEFDISHFRVDDCTFATCPSSPFDVILLLFEFYVWE